MKLENGFAKRHELSCLDS